MPDYDAERRHKAEKEAEEAKRKKAQNASGEKPQAGGTDVDGCLVIFAALLSPVVALGVYLVI